MMIQLSETLRHVAFFCEHKVSILQLPVDLLYDFIIICKYDTVFYVVHYYGFFFEINALVDVARFVSRACTIWTVLPPNYASIF